MTLYIKRVCEHTLVVAKVCAGMFLAVSSGMAGGGGWGFAGIQPQQRPAMTAPVQNYETAFNSLFPINGMVTGGWSHKPYPSILKLLGEESLCVCSEFICQ